MNRILLIGNIGMPPAIRETDEKIPYAVLSLATNEKWIDSKGVQQMRTDWHRIVVFREKFVEFIRLRLRTGSRVFVEGKLQYRKILQEDGTENTIGEVIISQKGPGTLTLLQPLYPRTADSDTGKSMQEDVGDD